MKFLQRAARLLIALARELSDENGYRRFLQTSGRTHSGPEWRAYIDRRHRRKFQNAKCC